MWTLGHMQEMQKLPFFGGAPLECPQKFLNKMRKFCKDLDDEAKQQVVAEQLLEDAAV